MEQLGDRFGAGATGVLQSALGNLPELFICIFSLRAGLVDVVRAALVGSILANLLLVLGLAFFVGGLKHGTQQLGSERARTIVVLMLLSVTAWVIPSLAHFVHAPASEHEMTFSVIVSVVLLALFALSLPFSLRRDDADDPDNSDEGAGHEQPRWPLSLALGMLAAAGAGAAFVSDWFVVALEPTMESVGISQAFAGLVVVAIAGNAVENVVGIQLAAAGKSEYAFSIVLNIADPDRPGARAGAGDRLAGLRARLAHPGAEPAARRVAAARDHPGGVHRLRRRVDLARGRVAGRALRDHRHRLLVGLRPAPRASERARRLEARPGSSKRPRS